MAYLEYKRADQRVQRFELVRHISTIGSAPENHLAISDLSLGAVHASVLREKGSYRIKVAARSMPMRIGGKKTKDKVLVHGDLVCLGEVELCFSTLEALEPAKDPAPERLHKALDTQARLLRLSQILLEEKEPQALLAALMDDVIALSHADKGFLVLSKNEDYEVCVARRSGGEDLPKSQSLLSDNIVRTVLETQEPQFIGNAGQDPRFNKSQSVIDLKLTSVMCVPLIARTQLLGLIYVGSDRPTHQFDESDLQVLRIFAAQAALVVQTAYRLTDLRVEQARLNEKIHQLRFGALVGACPQMIENFRSIEKVAPSDMPVWLHGEPGTGKELLARELHQRSPRREHPFECINCAVIPAASLSQELFGPPGHADQGAIARAAGGTLYLAEIEHLSPALQLGLLRAMADDHRIVTDRGSIRIITSSHRSATELLSEKRLREELFFRLRVIELGLPPLRERGDDVELIARFLLHREVQNHAPGKALDFSESSLRAMHSFAWPGNIRQLENHLKKAVIMSDGPELSPGDLGLVLSPEQGEQSATKILPLTQAKERWQREYINRALALNDGNRAQTARDLGVDPRTIFRHLERIERQKQEQAS